VKPSPDDAVQALGAFLRALGFDPDTVPHLQNTPQRVTDAWRHELLDGYTVDIARLLLEGSFASPPSPHDDWVELSEVDTFLMCPHHLLPAWGTASVAYVPQGRLVGIGILARLIDAYAHRLTLQEEVGRNVVDAIMTHLEAKAARCELRLRHSCLSCRGERKQATVRTVATAGPERFNTSLFGIDKHLPVR